MAATKAQAKPADQSAANKCKCGCGETVVKQFKPGHDARFASQLRAAVKAGTMTPDAALKAASDISPAFVSKMQKSLASVAREQGKDAK